MAPVFNFARYDVHPLADMTGADRGIEICGRRRSYDELGGHRHLVVSERLRDAVATLGLTQKEVVRRLRRMGVDDHQQGAVQPRARGRPRRRASSPSSRARSSAR